MPKNPREGETFEWTLARARSSSVGLADLACGGAGLPPPLVPNNEEMPREIGD